MYRLARLDKRLKTPAQRARRARKLARRAALRPLRSIGYDLPREALEAATADGYSAERFGLELAEEIERARARERRTQIMRLVAYSIVAGLALSFAIAWLL